MESTIKSLTMKAKSQDLLLLTIMLVGCLFLAMYAVA